MTEHQNNGIEAAPNSTAALVLGIVSIVTCWLYGIVGIACGIIAIVLGNKAIQQYNLNPELYSKSSFNNAKAGKICGIVGLCISGLTLLYFLIVGVAVFSTLSNQ